MGEIVTNYIAALEKYGGTDDLGGGVMSRRPLVAKLKINLPNGVYVLT